MYLKPRNNMDIIPSKQIDKEWYEDRVNRIIKMMGSDPGLFVLGIHSFVEGYIREIFSISNTDYSFYDLIQYLHDDIVEKKTGWISELSILRDFKAVQESTNMVRHNFAPLSPEEATAAVYRFKQFSKMVGLPIDRYMDKIDESLKLWDRSGDRFSDVKRLNSKGFLLLQEKRKNEQMQKELEELKSNREEKQHLLGKIEELEVKLSRESEKTVKSTEKAETLRKERWELKEQVRELSQKTNELESANDYLRELRTIVAYTRTRLDYEQSLLRLTQEQKRVLEHITLEKDFLIKGGAGTGKTLVLLKALEKAVNEVRQDKFDSEEPFTLTLLTYNRTLAKYDSYIAEIMKLASVDTYIRTVEGFLIDKFRELGKGEISKHIISTIIARINTLDFFNNYELETEIDSFIFGSLVTREEYIDEMIYRRGRKNRLTKRQREEVWEIVERCIKSMESKGLYSKNYACLLIAKEAARNEPQIDHIFIDEVQDLSTVELKALKLSAKKSAILAGDSDQSIYQTVFPIKRSGILIQGQTRILRTNFRNTVQIQAIAENYRKNNPELGHDDENQPEAFRNGPFPEIFIHSSREKSMSSIVREVDMLVNELAYDPENICILAPDKNSIHYIQGKLTEGGYRSYFINNSDFSFTERKVIRLSTLHSAKGLEFPVVLIYLPELPFVGEGYIEQEKSILQRNLLYVGVSRAMDYLNVFVCGNEQPQEIQSLIDCFDAS